MQHRWLSASWLLEAGLIDNKQYDQTSSLLIFNDGIDRGDTMNKPQLADSELVSRLQELLASGKFDHTGLHPEIAASWERSYASAVDCRSHPPMYFSTPEDEGSRVELEDIVIPVMVNIHKSLKGEGFLIILADEHGSAVESFPPHQPLLFSNWSEGLIGTNAIGTALKIKIPLQISGAEHYRPELHSLTSSAVPIFDHRGQVIGVLALIGPKQEDHSHVLSLLHKAVKLLVYKWRVAEKNRQLLTYNNHLNNIINIMTDGIIIVSEDGIVEQANPAAARILGKKAPDLLGTHLGNILDDRLENMLKAGRTFVDMELLLDRNSGRIHCLASGQPSRDEYGEITGGMIILRSIDKVHRMVNNICGTRAELNFSDIIGSSPAIQDTIEIARIAARNMSSILIAGESGTGKEIFAQAIHNESQRCRGPFVAVNCGAIPRELIGSELFGYVDGAFTGARRGGRLGKFEMAAGGTLFLDEIGDMPLDQQVVLLRVLQDKLVTRIGDSKEIPVDVRVICATNKDLLREVEKGNFRQDLYYRLNVISISIPPLRSRREDILLLADHYLTKLGVKGSSRAHLISPAVGHYLLNYSWPGNVRELQNVIERLAIIADNRTITIADLPPEIREGRSVHGSHDKIDHHTGDTPESYIQKKKHLIAEQESEQILMMLKQFGGNLTEVAKAMGFSRTTLYRKMEIYNIRR